MSNIPDYDAILVQVPLSFAAAVGSVSIMKMLRDHCEERCTRNPHRTKEHVTTSHMGKEAASKHCINHVTKYLTHQDDFGNSAMHIAVLHNQREAFDWLHQNGGDQALEVR